MVEAPRRKFGWPPIEPKKPLMRNVVIPKGGPTFPIGVLTSLRVPFESPILLNTGDPITFIMTYTWFWS